MAKREECATSIGVTHFVLKRLKDRAVEITPRAW